MGTLFIGVNKFLSTFSDVINMMMDLGILSSNVFSYNVAQDLSTMVVEERHIESFSKFLKETKDLLNQLNDQLSHRSKEGFEDIVLGFQGRSSIVTDSIDVNAPCNSEGKAHESSFTSTCGNATYAQMKTASALDVGFSSTSQQRYGSMNDAGCEISTGRFSPLNETQFNTATALSRNRHYAVPDNSSCYDITASSVGHDNSLSSHSAAFSLPNHMVVSSHFQSNCESAFDGSTNPMMHFTSCSRNTSLKQFSTPAESQNHDTQYVSHDKSQDFSSKPSCEFAQPNDTRDSQRFTSPQGHFSPPTESNCDTMYTSRCETTQDAHFSCDTSYETSNHSGHGLHASRVPFQTSTEQSLNTHYSHPSLSAESNFGIPSKSQHSSAFSMVTAINSSQYASCQSNSEKSQFPSGENGQSKMHYPQRNTMCESTFPQMTGNNSFVELSDDSHNTHITAQGVNEIKYPHVSSFKWGVLSDTEDSFDPSSPVQTTNQTQDSTEFGDLQIAFPNQVAKDTASLKRDDTGKDVLGTSVENSFSFLLGTRDTMGCVDMNKKKLDIFDGVKQEGGKWKCPVCAKLFIARVNFERHFKVQHLGQKAFPCNLCDKGFSSKIRLDAHLMRQHNINCESANPCNVCGKLFNTKTALKTHSLTHVDESEKPFACNICSKRFSQKVVLDTHLLRHGGPSAYKFQCKICSKSFPTKPKLKFHWRKHETAQFHCKECPKEFPNEGLLRAHEATHVAFSERPFQCSECPKTFTTKHKLQSHIETHSQTNQYSCDECSSVFKCRSTLVAHTRKRHPKSDRLLPNPTSDCPDPSSTFPSAQPIPQLESPHALTSNPTFKCPICLKEFRRKKNLREHEITCHQEVPRLACDHCPKRFKAKTKLKIHLATHTEEPSLACRTCGKRFYRSDLLRTHEATHTGNKPFSCDVCARRFATQSMLRSHQVIHQPPPETSAEVPCPTCGKKFKNKRTLALHVKCHAESLEFKCGTCGKQFARRVHYDGHMRTHSADRPYSCTVCNRTFRERKHRADHMRRLHPNEVLGGGELTLQKLIESISADDTMDATTGGGSFATDVNSDALATLTELSNSGMQHLLEDSSQQNSEPHIDDTSQSQGSQINANYGPGPRTISLEPQVDSVNQNSQMNHLNQSFSSQPHNVNIDCQADLTASNQVNHLTESFSVQAQNISLLQNPFHHLKSSANETHPFTCSESGDLSPLPELSDQLQSMEVLHPHYGHGGESTRSSSVGGSDESLPKLADVLAISIQGGM